MEALYWQPPPAAKLAAAGLRDGDHPRPVAEVWPENMPALELFGRVATQWRTGANGPTGLDYNVVYRELDRLKLDDESQDELMASIRVIESAALRAMRED